MSKFKLNSTWGQWCIGCWNQTKTGMEYLHLTWVVARYIGSSSWFTEHMSFLCNAISEGRFLDSIHKIEIVLLWVSEIIVVYFRKGQRPSSGWKKQILSIRFIFWVISAFSLAMQNRLVYHLLLYSDVQRMKKAIRNLIDAPQNNFRVFHNGNLTYSENHQANGLHHLLTSFFGDNM